MFCVIGGEMFRNNCIIASQYQWQCESEVLLQELTSQIRMSGITTRNTISKSNSNPKTTVIQEERLIDSHCNNEILNLMVRCKNRIFKMLSSEVGAHSKRQLAKAWNALAVALLDNWQIDWSIWSIWFARHGRFLGVARLGGQETVLPQN
jgi:hypothetical protein